MEKYWRILIDAYTGYWNYLVNEIAYPQWHNYFWWLVGLSLMVWLLEIIVPWRRDQPVFRKDFWLDAFYMFFNFFLFALLGYNAVSNIAVQAFADFLSLFGIHNLVAIQLEHWPVWARLSLMFVLADFIQWNVHRILHRIPWMWEFHKVHHSVNEMGFAAHLRFHWMETIIYKTIQYIPLAMIGFGLQDFFIIHIMAVLIGHLNHSNLNITYGPLKYVLNNPAMHIWHHARELPNPVGVNYGISLSVWDYIFGTAYLPRSGKDVPLGFVADKDFPKTFLQQFVYPLRKSRRQG